MYTVVIVMHYASITNVLEFKLLIQHDCYLTGIDSICLT